MITADYFHIADEAIISRDGKVSVIGIFDVIWAAVVPVLHPRLALVAHVSASLSDASQHECKFRLALVDGPTVWESPATSLVLRAQGPGRGLTANVVATLAQLPFPQLGEYAFSLLVDDREAASSHLAVRPLSERPD